MKKRATSLTRKVVASIVLMTLMTLGLPSLTAPVLAAEGEAPCTDSGPGVFTVTITNVSDSSDTPTPFAPGVYAVHSDPNVLFISGQPNLGNGLEALVEDGNPHEIHAAISSMMMMDVDMLDMDMMMDVDMLDMDMMMSPMMMDMMMMDMMMDMSADELSAMLMMGMDMGMAMMMDMSEEDLAAVATGIQDIVTALTTGMSDDEIMTMMATGMEIAGAEDMMGMSVNDIAALALIGVDMVTSMSTDELVGMLRLGMDLLAMEMDMMAMEMDLLAMDMMAMENVVAPMMMDMMMMAPMMMDMMMMGDDVGLIPAEALILGMAMMMEEPGLDDDMTMMMDMGELHAGVFNTPVGMDGPGPLLPGAAYEFSVVAYPGPAKLSLASMFVQSNDWFVSTPAEGTDLFMEDGTPVEGVIAMHLYDAGTEADEPVGEGANQAPRQSGPNMGPADDDNTVRAVAMMDASDLVEVTLAYCRE